ncbi:hypothetical protein ACFO4R_03945 [Filifactor villosus]|uniref:Uncharacterized protein n=1 Tax=Filifactor villosus TaxID=29374 RepID=A0ABV9QKP3_9FIRM
MAAKEHLKLFRTGRSHHIADGFDRMKAALRRKPTVKQHVLGRNEGYLEMRRSSSITSVAFCIERFLLLYPRLLLSISR